MTTPVQLLSPEEILTRQAVQAQRIRLADTSSVFRERALRLRQLAAGHSMREYLIFMADLAQAQHQVLAQPRALALPSQAQLDDALHQGQPPLSLACWSWSQGWQQELQEVLLQLLPQAPEGSVLRATLQRLQELPADERQRQAERLLGGIMRDLDLGMAPLLGAALQLHWTRLVAQTEAAYPGRAFAPVDDGRVCPCCGSAPVASVRRLSSHDGHARYLHCALCQTEWHMVRIQCTHCESTQGIHYEALERSDGAPAAAATGAAPGAVQAECCDSCGHYLKIMAMDKDPQVDPVADDLATVALDLLLSDSGVQRHGLNLMLLWGDPESGTEAGAP